MRILKKSSDEVGTGASSFAHLIITTSIMRLRKVSSERKKKFYEQYLKSLLSKKLTALVSQIILNLCELHLVAQYMVYWTDSQIST